MLVLNYSFNTPKYMEVKKNQCLKNDVVYLYYWQPIFKGFDFKDNYRKTKMSGELNDFKCFLKPLACKYCDMFCRFVHYTKQNTG